MNLQLAFTKLTHGALFVAMGLLLAAGLRGASTPTRSDADLTGTLDQATLTKMKAQFPPSLPRRTILLVIDGMAFGAIERLPLVNLEKLKAEGAYFRELVLPLAAHPRFATRNEDDPSYYPWTCSIPNPVMMTGTLFIGQPGIKDALLQHSYRRAGKPTAFVVDSDAYTEIAGGYDTFQQDWNSDDDSPVLPAVQTLIEEKNPWFIRVHLQSTGAGGYIDQRAKRSIWNEKSEYRRRTMKADALVGKFISWLKEKGFWDETVVFICGDHGQSDTGGHSAYEPHGNQTSLLVAGKGIKRGAVFPYAEMIDVAPTIAYLQDVPVPRYSHGRLLTEAFVNGPSEERRDRVLEQLDEVMLRHHALIAANPVLAAQPLNREFLLIEQIGSWHKRFRDLPSLLAHQQDTLKQLEGGAASGKK